MTSEQLDLDDLDAEDLKALAEVSKKGYYHARPKSEAAPAPQRMEVAESIPAVAPTGKREDFDAFQKKWDRFDHAETDMQDSSSVSAPSRINTQPAAAPAPRVQQPPPQADEVTVAQLISMGFDEAQSREAAIATGNDADAAVEYILGGGSASGRAPSGPAPGQQAQLALQAQQPVKADEEQLSLLLEMGFPEQHARTALEACKNDLERAIEHAANLGEQSQSRLQRARGALSELEVEMAALEAAGAPDAKRLRYLEENLTQASCSLDSVDVGSEEVRAERRLELDRCNTLDSRLNHLRQKMLDSKASDVPQAADESTGASAETTVQSAEASDETTSTTVAAGIVDGAGAPSPVDADVNTESAAEDTDAAVVGATSERIAEAERLRLQGNTAFKAEDFKEAVKNYLGALALDRENVAILSNLAAAELKLGDFEAAAAHAGEANLLSGGFSAKALFRQGQALEGLGNFAEACKAFRAAIEIEPSDRLMRQRLEDCQKHAIAAASQPASAAGGAAEGRSAESAAESPSVAVDAGIPAHTEEEEDGTRTA